MTTPAFDYGPVLESFTRRLPADREIRKQARADGLDNIPGGEDSDLTRLEHEVVTAAEAAHDQVRDGLLRGLRDVAEAADQAAPGNAELDFDDRIDDCRLSLDEKRDDWRREVEAAHAKAVRRAKELSDFRRDQGLGSRTAKYPDSVLLPIGILAAVGAAETYINGIIFAPASDGGLFGAAATLLAPSLANLGLGFIVGIFGLRHAIHGEGGWRWAGIATVVVGTAFIAALNVVLGHWRALIENNPDARVQDVGPVLLQAPAAFCASPMALALFGLGIVAAGIAAWEGYSGVDDPHPGFGCLDRRCKAAREAFSQATQAWRDGISRMIGAEIDAVNRTVAAIEARVKTVSALINGASVGVRAAEHAAQEIVRACARALKAYREENRRSRPDGAAPGYFASMPLADPGISSLPAFDLDGKRGRLKESRDQAFEAALAAKSSLRRMEEQELATAAEMVADIENGQGRREVSRLALGRIA